MSPMAVDHGADVAQALLALGQKALDRMKAEVEAREAAHAALTELATQLEEFQEDACFSTPIAFEGLSRSFGIYAHELAERVSGSHRATPLSDPHGRRAWLRSPEVPVRSQHA